jgi:ribosomal protein S18 acetylase RimI-like enzyme
VEGTVRPAWRRRGLASTLVPRMVQRARAHVAERGADLRPVIRAQALSEDADLASVLARAGFRPVRWTFVMEADLDALTESPDDPEGLPPGYTLGTWEGVPADELRAAHNTAFVGHPGWSAWSPEMWEQWVTGSRNYRPALSLLARDRSDAIAAYVQTCEYDAVQAATGVREAVAVKVGTLPEHRGLGLATALLRTAMRRWAADGFDRAALDVDSENPSGANAIYERVGFVVTTRFTDHLLDA